MEKIITLLIVIVIVLSNCSHINDTEDSETILNCCLSDFYDHYLLLSFQDASGNDLLSGIVNPELYTLDVVFPDEIKNPLHAKDDLELPMTPPPALVLHKTVEHLNSDYDYLSFRTSSNVYAIDSNGNRVERPFDEPLKITFRLKYPYLFGDSATHDIVTWWELVVEERYIIEKDIIEARNLPEIEGGYYYEIKYVKCSLIEFGGTEITEINQEEFYPFSTATIVLDR